MKLALRYELPADAPAKAVIGGALIEGRLVTKYAHGGIVIGADLYHSNATHGVHREANADLSGWLLIDLGAELDARALVLFEQVKGLGYDWFSLSAFVVVPDARDSARWYCFELCFLLMTGCIPLERVTGEALLVLALQRAGLLLTAPPVFKSRPMEIAA